MTDDCYACYACGEPRETHVPRKTFVPRPGVRDPGCRHGEVVVHWVQNPVFGSCGEGEWCYPPKPTHCDRPPEGWFCTQLKGHSGPCPAHQNTPDMDPDRWGEVAFFPKEAKVGGLASYRIVEEPDGYRVYSDAADGAFT